MGTYLQLGIHFSSIILRNIILLSHKIRSGGDN